MSGAPIPPNPARTSGDLLRFFQRPNPSANSVLLRGPRPILVDTGFGSDTAELEEWLRAQDTPAHTLSLIVNTHHHSDHVGGNHHLQGRYGRPIAAHPWEAHPVNTRHPEAGNARWLNQPVQAYRVQTLLIRNALISVTSGTAPNAPPDRAPRLFCSSFHSGRIITIQPQLV